MSDTTQHTPADVRELAVEIIRSLDLIARNYDSYEYGLPVMTHYDEMVDTVVALLRTPAAPAPGWSEVRERANMLRAVLREHGFEHLRSALVGQRSDAVFYGQWERHKTLLRDLLDALDAALRSEAQGEADDFNPLTDLLPEHEAERVERVLSRAARRGEGGA